MAIKTEAARKARTIEGKPVREWFNAAAKKEGRSNQFATPEADKPTSPHYADGKAKLATTFGEARASARRRSRYTRIKPGDSDRTKEYKQAVKSDLDKSTPGERKAKVDALHERSEEESKRREEKNAAAPAAATRAADSYVSKPGNKSVMDMPSGNADVEAGKQKRIADAKAKDARQKKDFAMNVGKAPYMPNKARLFF